MKRILAVIALLATVCGTASAEFGVKKKRPLPYDYGKVVINNYSDKAGMQSVVFDHWIHRSKFTCRLCHVDIGFGMKAGSTGIKAADNKSGYYCGSCHNDKTIAGAKVFKACEVNTSAPDMARCRRCHSRGKAGEQKYDFASFTERFPRDRFGNGINWELTEEKGYIQPIDFLEGISFKRKALPVQKDFALNPKLSSMPDIVFSHKKHTVWSGCELCHPEIFVGVKKGLTKYSMADIYEGKYCGACHSSVAFPLIDCQRCHTEPVQPQN
jgi:c(7)-type cytochrome triheme protein